MKINREFLVFCVFLLIAVAFWFIQTFKETTSATVEYQIELTGVPKSLVVTSKIPKSVSVTVSGRGFDVLNFITRPDTRKLSIDFSTLNKQNGVILIDNAAWRRILQSRLGRAITLSSINPSTLEIFYSTGSHKYILVDFNGQVSVDNKHVLCDVKLQPTYVEVFAPKAILDTLSHVNTESVRYSNLTDTLSKRLALAPPAGVKCVPDSIDATFCVDLFLKKTLRVEIFCENVPDNYIMRTFPLFVDVNFRVSSAHYNTISAKDFTIVADYTSIHPTDQQCPIYVRQKPDGVDNITLSQQNVKILLEPQNTTED